MIEEWGSLLENKTWNVIDTSDIPRGHSILKNKLVFKIKRDAKGSIFWFKARWVIKKYLQQYGTDYDQIFAAEAKPMIFRIFFAFAAFYDLNIEQIDVKTNFFYRLIDQLIFVKLPPEYKILGKIYKLNKTLYGLKQSPRLLTKNSANPYCNA